MVWLSDAPNSAMDLAIENACKTWVHGFEVKAISEQSCADATDSLMLLS